MSFPVDLSKAMNSPPWVVAESGDRLRQWLRRYQSRMGCMPPIDYTFPPIVSWLRAHVIANRNLLCGNDDAGLLVGFLLIGHARSWSRGFQDRLHLDHLYGRKGDTFTVERNILSKVLAALEQDLAATLDVFGPDEPALAFRTSFESKPETAAAFLAALTNAWHLATPALKFGLLGGFDTSTAIHVGTKADSVAAAVATVVASNSHYKFALPTTVVAGSISPKQIRYARELVQDYPRVGLEILRIHPCFNGITQGLCRNKSAQGLLKSPPAKKTANRKHKKI